MKSKSAVIVTVAFILTIPLSAKALDTTSVRKGVVRIIAIGREEAGTGTGFVINNSGNIVTNAHVIKPAQSGGILKVITDELAEELKPLVEARFGERVKAEGGIVSDQVQAEIIKFLIDRIPAARVKWCDEGLDLAVLDCDARGLFPLELTASEHVKEGQAAYALGFPGKGDRVGSSAFLSLKVYNGVIASKESKGSNNEKVYECTTPFSPGNSGGPLVTECGSVVGITSFHIGEQIGGVDVGESLRYAIQIDELIEVLKNHDISYSFSTGCSVGSSSFLLIGVLLAVGLGVVSVALAATNRGRSAFKGAIRNSIRLVKSHPAEAPGLPAMAERAAGLRASVPGPEMMIKGLAGAYAGKSFQINGNAIVIGRDPRACQIVFPPASHTISKRHCSIRYNSATGRLVLDDLGSTNGTFVDSRGQRARLWPGKSRELGIGDRFSVGGHEHVFDLQPLHPLSPQPQSPQGFNVLPVVGGLAGEFAGRTIPVGPDRLLMGRDPQACQIVFPDSLTKVSRRHCSLRYDAGAGGFIIEDLGSSHGTFIFSSGKQEQLRAGDPRRLSANDRFYLGDPKILFEVRLERK